ncbi:proprotein convertase subtilisin/kexin type 5-like [Haliotis cracherodii]|uniref:proprotein convertase subtilisin/kexin type 5-like n=1 Tax=Haliotis cracherodii TaxID=6455 RepID=UPI0039EAE63F
MQYMQNSLNSKANNRGTHLIIRRFYKQHTGVMIKMSGFMVLGCLFLLFHLHEYSAQYCAEGYVRLSVGWVKCTPKKTCQERGFVIHNGYCRRSCPRDFYISQEDRTCHKACPYDTVVNGSYCFTSTQCTDMDMFVYNGGCVESCLPETVVTMSGVCVHNCPNETITNTTHCINPNNCTEAGKVIYNETCMDNCPPGSPYVVSGACASDCPPDKVLYHHQCITQHGCIQEEGKLIQGRSCVESCSPDTPNLYEGRCHTECPSGTVLNASLSTCLVDSVCADRGQFIHNKTCIAECPRYVSGKVCVDECPERNVLHHKECITITRCTSFKYLYMFVFNGTCVTSCPEEAPNTYLDYMCYAVCPWNYVAEDRRCVSKYECSSKIIHNNTCVTSCPARAPLFNIDSFGMKSCLSICPAKTVINDKQCVSDKLCKSKQMVIFNGTCLITCPWAAPYHSRGICHQQCPQGQRAVDTECIECESDKLIDGKECIYKFQCQERNKFHHQGMCLSSCPHGTIDNKYVLGNTCLAQPDLPLLLTLIIVAILVCIIICICMTIPRNGIGTQSKGIKATLTTKNRHQVYKNHGFEEHEVGECSDDTNDVNTGPFRQRGNEGADDVDVVATDENDQYDITHIKSDDLVDILNEMEQGSQSET